MASEASALAPTTTEPIDITDELVEAPILDSLENDEAPELLIPEFKGLAFRPVKTAEDEARRKARIPPEWVKKNATAKQPKKTRAERKKLNPLRSEKYTPEYVFEDGLRRVKPYYFTFNTFCKERWRDRTLVDVFQSEFRDRPIEYYEQAIKEGSVLINGTVKSTLETVIKDGDYISHKLHRHEPPVSDRPVGIVYEDDRIMAINKPAGVPVHPAGRYHFNSVVEILKFERGGDWNPLPCNRLDRLTSGLMFIAKTREAAEDMMSQLKTRTVKKQYVARVKGNFPDEDVEVDQPILSISPKLGLNQVRANGKHAKTVFQKISYNAEKDYSIVRALPLTGRTHQIRVHLQFLGHPIMNDPIYSNRKVFGPNLGKGGTDNDEDLITRLNRMGKDEVAAAVEYYDDMMTDYVKRKAELMTGEVCADCGTPLYSDPGEQELGIYLHAIKYECNEGNWAYETPMPEWAV
ncbi:pseudouridine synthase [Ascobolus immersus RN42]|uniref:Pseudouridine synthase n=1 Tax=Ascobolus immersus RN42 TaxID=1160509 RepID=A0A3N4I121_ASCIM|nr:pseudouridine synthase [Ascobolus immersus RN42]